MAATDPRPAPFPLPLRGQATTGDARAERLIRQIRTEVEDLRVSLAELSAAQDDMVQIDLDAVVQDPEAAAALPPAVLVRGLIAAAERINTLRGQVVEQETLIARLEDENHRLQLDDSFHRGRLETLDEVIAALHGNLRDLRADRDHSRLGLAGPAPQIAPAAIEHGE